MTIHQFRRPTPPPRKRSLGPGIAAAAGVVAGAVAALLLRGVLGGFSTLLGLVVAFLVYRVLSGEGLR